MPEPSQKFVELVNTQYARIVAHARLTWDEAELQLLFDTEYWTATIAVGPPRTFDRWVVGHGPTLDRAVSALEDALGLARWDG